MAEDHGIRCVDSSCAPDDPDRVFYMQVVLLFLVADYPGMAKFTGFGHHNCGFKHCHWCNHTTPLYLQGRAVFRDHASYLPPGDPLRDDAVEPNSNPPPSPRTIAETVDASIAARDYRGPFTKHPGKRSGVYYWCCLILLDLFDIIWDASPDYMHLLKNIWCSVLLPMFNGELSVAYPRKSQLTDSLGAPLESDAMELVEAAFQARKEKYAVATRVSTYINYNR